MRTSREKILKIGLAVAVVLLGLTTVALVVGYWVIAPKMAEDALRGRLARLERDAGVSVTTGAVRPDGSDGVIVEEFELGRPKGDGHLVRIERMTVRLDRASLFSGDTVIASVSLQGVEVILTERAEGGFDVEEIGRTSGPFRDYYYDDPTFLEESERVEGGYEERDGVRYETLVVLHGRLRDWSPPPTAHLPPTAAE